MEFSASDLSAIAFVAAVAMVSGLLLARLHLPAVVGYVLTGIILGSSGFAVVDGTSGAGLLAELGVILLVFLVGMSLSLRAFVAVLPTAVLCTLLQIGASAAIAVGFAQFLGQSLPTGVLFGCFVALSSTSVAVGLLDDLRLLRSRVGRISVGLLIAQGLSLVPMLVVIDAVGGLGFDRIALLKLLLATGAVTAFVWGLSRRRRLKLPVHNWLNGRDELVPLAALGLCFAAAALSSALGLTAAFGAFLTGLAIGNTADRVKSVRTTRSFQRVAQVAFFLPVALMLDLSFLWENLPAVLGWLALIIIMKTAVHISVLHFLGVPWQRAFPAGVILGQVGEFSFVLAAVGSESGLLTADGGKMAIAVIGLSALVSPLLQRTARRFNDAPATRHQGLRTTLAHAYASEFRRLECGATCLRRLVRPLAGGR